MATLVIKTPGVSTKPGLLKLERDMVLSGANNGVRFLFDLSPAAYPEQSDPVTGQTVDDISAHGAGSVLLATPNAGLVDYVGNGFDFSACVADPAVVRAAAGCLQSIWDATNDYFMVAFYAKLPLKTEWNSIATLAAMFCSTTSAQGYATGEADLVCIAQATGYLLSARRQTAGATQTTTQITLADDAFGKIAQIAYWRNAAGVGLRCKTTATSQTVTGAAGVNNTTDFSAKQPRFGVCESFNDLSGQSAHRDASNYRLYRGWIEDLTLSGRDPATVLDADWERVQARNVFS